MSDNKVAIIEVSADSLFFVLLGDKNIMENIAKELQESESENYIKYVTAKIGEPVINKYEELLKTINSVDSLNDLESIDSKNVNYIEINDGVESAQCYTCAEGYSNQLYTLMTLTKTSNQHVLSYPKLELAEDDNPDCLIKQWIKNKMKKVPSGILKNTKVIASVGNKENILVVATKANKQKSTQK